MSPQDQQKLVEEYFSVCRKIDRLTKDKKDLEAEFEKLFLSRENKLHTKTVNFEIPDGILKIKYNKYVTYDRLPAATKEQNPYHSTHPVANVFTLDKLSTNLQYFSVDFREKTAKIDAALKANTLPKYLLDIVKNKRNEKFGSPVITANMDKL